MAIILKLAASAILLTVGTVLGTKALGSKDYAHKYSAQSYSALVI